MKIVSVTMAGNSADVIGDALRSVVDEVDYCYLLDTRAVIVDRGKIVADGTPAELLAQSGTGSLTDLFRSVTSRDTVAA